MAGHGPTTAALSRGRGENLEKELYSPPGNIPAGKVRLNLVLVRERQGCLQAGQEDMHAAASDREPRPTTRLERIRLPSSKRPRTGGGQHNDGEKVWLDADGNDVRRLGD